MIGKLRYGLMTPPILAAGLYLASAVSAGAQISSLLSNPIAGKANAAGTSNPSKSDSPKYDPPKYDPWASTRPAEPADDVAETTDAPVDTSHADDMKDVDVDKLDWSQLGADASTLTTRQPGKAQSASTALASSSPNWSSNNNGNGSSAVSVKQSLAGFLDPQVGADMMVAQPQALTESQILAERLANGGSLPESSGSAWASVSAPGVDAIWDKTSVLARVDPGQDQSRLGTSLSKSVPLTGQYSLTLENGYNVVEQGIGAVGRPTRSYDTEQTAKLNLNDIGTSFTAGQTFSSSDERWLHSVGAEQKLFGGVSINGSISETSAGPENKSITAGYKQSW